MFFDQQQPNNEMNTPTPTPRTDMATYPADCLGTTLVTNRDCSRALERELDALTAERDQLRAEVEKVYALVTPVGFDLPGGIFETAQAVAKLRAERDQLRAELNAAKEQLRTEAVDDYSSIKGLQRELCTEREKLYWIFQNCKVTAEDYTTGNRDVYAIHDRDGLGAAMKEDAK